MGKPLLTHKMSCPCCLRLGQVTAFVTNSGDVPVCELVLKPLTTGTVYSFWPDWASSSSYEVFFSPKQVTGAGTQHTFKNVRDYFPTASYGLALRSGACERQIQ